MNETISISFTIDSEYLYQMKKSDIDIYFSQNTRLKMLRFAFIALSILITYIMFSENNYIGLALFGLLTILMGAVAYTDLGPMLIAKSFSKSKLSQQLIGSDVKWLFSDDKITNSINDKIISIKWSQVERLEECTNGYFIVTKTEGDTLKRSWVSFSDIDISRSNINKFFSKKINQSNIIKH